MDYKLTIHIVGAKFNFMAAFKDSFTKSSILTALGMAFLKDMLAVVENPLLKKCYQRVYELFRRRE